MHASRSDWRGIARPVIAGLLLGCIGLLPATAPGQPVGPPISLLPPPAPKPLSLVPDHDDAVASEALAPPATGWGSGGVPPPDRLSEKLWRGTTRAVADLLLARLPDTTSPALQLLERRLLLSPAAAPEGPDEAGRDLPALRAAALLRLGELDAAREIVAGIPKSERGSALPLLVTADAIGGDIGAACATVRERVRHHQDRFGQTALIACQALQGNLDEASLGLQVLAEEHGLGHSALAAAVDALSGHPAAAEIGQAEGLDPLTLRLLIKARLTLDPGLAETLPADLALCVALDEDAPAAARLAAAERAAQLGALPADRLAARYAASADGEKPGDVPAFEHARRFVAIAKADDPAGRLSRLEAFVKAFGAKNSGFTLAARLVSPVIRDLEPQASDAAAAPLIARLLIATGEYREAQRWCLLARDAEGQSLRELLALAADDEEPNPDSADPVRTPLLLALAAALGKPVSPAEWAGLPASAWSAAGPPPPAAAWIELADAVQAKRIGETVLTAIIVAAPAGHLTTDPVGLFTAVSALHRIGLDADARRLAVEAAIGARHLDD